jgi:glycosyltransferase involved in cell wall biosynthesis
MSLKKSPMISVVMSVYNGERFILKAIESIKKQTYKNWELLIANDASTDSTKEILKKIKIKKIRIINFKKNIGQHKAINYLLNISKGKYIAVLDSDDVASVNRLQTQLNEMNKDSGLTLVASFFKKIDDKNRIIENVKLIYNQELFKKIFPVRNIICFSTIMFKKEVLKKVKFLSTYYDYSNDYFFLLKIFLRYKIKIINKYLVFYRLHLNQRSKASTLKLSIIQENIKLLMWSKKNLLINKYNFLFFYKELFKKYLKLHYFRFKNIFNKNFIKIYI